MPIRVLLPCSDWTSHVVSETAPAMRHTMDVSSAHYHRSHPSAIRKSKRKSP